MARPQKGEDSREALRKLTLERAERAATIQAQVVAQNNPVDPRQEVVEQNLQAKQYLSNRSGVEQPFYIFIRTQSGREYLCQMLHRRARPIASPEEKAKLLGELLASKLIGHIPVDAIEYVAIAGDKSEAEKYRTQDILK